MISIAPLFAWMVETSAGSNVAAVDVCCSRWTVDEDSFAFVTLLDVGVGVGDGGSAALFLNLSEAEESG